MLFAYLRMKAWKTTIVQGSFRKHGYKAGIFLSLVNIRNDVSETERGSKLMGHRSLVSGDFFPMVGGSMAGEVSCIAFKLVLDGQVGLHQPDLQEREERPREKREH